MKDKLKRKGYVVVILNTPSGKKRFVSNNIITTAGDIFYAQKCAGETPTNNFRNLRLGSSAPVSTSKSSTTSSITLIPNTEKALSNGYPKTNCEDPDNGFGGENVITYKYEYGKADFNAPVVSEGIICVQGASAGDPVLCHFAFDTAFEKTANDTLVIFINHEGEGV